MAKTATKQTEPVDAPYPRGQDLRQAIVDRAFEYSRLTGMGLAVIGREAVGDVNFVSQVQNGRNFTIGTYDKFMKYLDAKMAARAAQEAKAKAK